MLNRDNETHSQPPQPQALRRWKIFGSPSYALIGSAFLLFVFAGFLIGLLFDPGRGGPLAALATFVRETSINWPVIAGWALISTGMILTAIHLVNGTRRDRFVDIDDKYSSSSIKSNIHDNRSSDEQGQAADKDTQSFKDYFNAIRTVLEQKADASDEKASKLLDKGTAYSRYGIYFFLLAIVGWQVFIHFEEFKPQHIYGMASCSLLFIFIEFLSAWFLKQYRQFVDTSTYLIKVKSIFDKYMLLYLAANDTKEPAPHLMELLKGDIPWPDSYLATTLDVSFAKEALETMSLFLKNMRAEGKHVAGSSKSANTE